MEHEVSSAQIWKSFHDRIGLSDAHIAELRSKRGFSDETISKLQFKSSRKENRAVLEEMLKTYPGRLLEKVGLAKHGPDGFYPEGRQYCGKGRTNRKDEKGEHIWDWIEPVLIPYFDEAGEIVAIRPHKGNPKKPEGTDDYDESWRGLQIYCPLLLRLTAIDESDKLVVLTEGEFKAAALMQAGIPALAFPGIHSMRNYRFRNDVVSLLQRFEVRNIVIVFDNETKDDPNFLDKYKPDPWDRYDAPHVRPIHRQGSLRSRVPLPPRPPARGVEDRRQGRLGRRAREIRRGGQRDRQGNRQGPGRNSQKSSAPPKPAPRHSSYSRPRLSASSMRNSHASITSRCVPMATRTRCAWPG